MPRSLVPICCLLLLANCGNDPPADIMRLTLDSAELSDPEVTAGGVAIDGMRISAHLHAVDTGGGIHDFTVILSGASLGGVGIWSSELEDGTRDLLGIGLDVSDAKHLASDAGYQDAQTGLDGASSGGGPLTIGDLFESYSGAGFGMHMAIGGAIYYFKNDPGVVIWLGGLTPGFGINWGLLAGLRMAVAN